MCSFIESIIHFVPLYMTISEKCKHFHLSYSFVNADSVKSKTDKCSKIEIENQTAPQYSNDWSRFRVLSIESETFYHPRFHSEKACPHC